MQKTDPPSPHIPVSSGTDASYNHRAVLPFPHDYQSMAQMHPVHTHMPYFHRNGAAVGPDDNTEEVFSYRQNQTVPLNSPSP